MKRKVQINTLHGPTTIEGLTVSSVRKLLDQAPDDAVCVFMFEITATTRKEMMDVDLMVMPCHSVHGGDKSDVCAFVGPEIENAKFEPHYRPEPPPVDRSKQCTTSGEEPDVVRERQAQDGNTLHDSYIVLCDAERAKGFVRPYRDAYRHLKCGTITTMGRTIAETYARDPGFYGSTYCVHCKAHFPVGEDGEFTWYENDGSDGPKVGT